jgi:hypothetical protein
MESKKSARDSTKKIDLVPDKNHVLRVVGGLPAYICSNALAN